MTSKTNNLNYGPPPPITKLTMEQDLQMRVIEDRLNSGEVKMKDLITVFLAMQRQNFVMGNSIKNLINKWPTVHPTINEVPAMFGILLETKD
jgi:hypothetical protein